MGDLKKTWLSWSEVLLKQNCSEGIIKCCTYISSIRVIHFSNIRFINTSLKAVWYHPEKNGYNFYVS